MKFTINRNLFIENLNNVMRAISSRATIPILSGIKLDLTEDELKKAMQDRETYLAEVKKRAEDYRASKATTSTSTTPKANSTAVKAADFNF